MSHQLYYKSHLLKYYFLILVSFCFAGEILSQKTKADSLNRLLERETIDSIRVQLLWQLARAIKTYSPDTALIIAQQSLFLAKKIDNIEGQSRSLGVLANTFMILGNYPRALELNFQKLQLEEKRINSRNLAGVLMDIGIVYVMQEEYHRALEYYAKADSVILKYNVEDLKYNIALNIGDAYDRLNISDSAYMYYNKSLNIAENLRDGDLIGTSMTGLGHSYKKLGNNAESLVHYQNAIKFLQEANNDETLCEAALGLADLYAKINKYDSSGHYANLSLSIARNDGFLSRELEAAEFLTGHYKVIKNIDSAFAYAEYSQQLNASLNSKTKIRELQMLSGNEQFRQRELEENRRIAEKTRSQQLQMLMIGIFIPGFFLLTVILSQAKIHIKVIRLLGILSLLFLFEYLTLLLHPGIAELTHHTPVFEILIFVGIAAILIPAHHRLEHWIIQKLIHHRTHQIKRDNQDKGQPV